MLRLSQAAPDAKLGGKLALGDKQKLVEGLAAGWTRTSVTGRILRASLPPELGSAQPGHDDSVLLASFLCASFGRQTVLRRRGNQQRANLLHQRVPLGSLLTVLLFCGVQVGLAMRASFFVWMDVLPALAT